MDGERESGGAGGGGGGQRKGAIHGLDLLPSTSLSLSLSPLSPRVTFCGYSIPHPSEAVVNMRIQTTGNEGGRE